MPVVKAREVSDPLELELQVVESCLVWVWRTEVFGWRRNKKEICADRNPESAGSSRKDAGRTVEASNVFTLTGVCSGLSILK